MSTSPPTLYGNPEVFARKYPHTWEAEEFAKGKYPPGPAWTPGHLDPDWRPPTTMAPKTTPTYAQAVAPLLKERRVARREVLSRLPPLRLRQEGFL